MHLLAPRKADAGGVKPFLLPFSMRLSLLLVCCEPPSGFGGSRARAEMVVGPVFLCRGEGWNLLFCRLVAITLLRVLSVF